MWLLWGVRDNQGMCVAVTGCVWQSRNVCGCYGVYVTITECVWLLWGVRGNHGMCVVVTGCT